MAYECTTNPEAPDLRGARFGSAFLTGLVTAIARRISERRAARTLSDMDDHLLQDIGVSRDEITRLVHTGRLDTTVLEPRGIPAGIR